MEKILYSIGGQVGQITFFGTMTNLNYTIFAFFDINHIVLFSSGINNICFVLFCHQHTGLLFCYSFNNMAVKINNS